MKKRRIKTSIKPTTKLLDNRKTIANHYSTSNFDAQFVERASSLFEIFNYKIKNRELRRIDVTGEGQWIKVWITKKEYRALSSRSKKELKRILENHLYPGRSFRWGHFKYYMALGPNTVRANKQWGGNNSYGQIRFH